jgi:hypothetical protein
MKVAKYLFIGLFLSLQTNCSYDLENVEAPKHLVSKDTFTLVLQDVMVVESYYKSQQANVNSFFETLPAAMHPVFDKYNIDSLRYVESMNYYTTQQDVLIEMYNEIQDSLTLNTPDLTQ